MIDERIAIAAPEERGRFERLRESVLNIGEGTAGQLLASALARIAGGGL